MSNETNDWLSSSASHRRPTSEEWNALWEKTSHGSGQIIRLIGDVLSNSPDIPAEDYLKGSYYMFNAAVSLTGVNPLDDPLLDPEVRDFLKGSFAAGARLSAEDALQTRPQDRSAQRILQEDIAAPREVHSDFFSTTIFGAIFEFLLRYKSS